MQRDTFTPGPLAEVRVVEDDDGRWTLVFVRELGHAPGKVWAALTDPAQLREWAPFTADRDLAADGAMTLQMLDGPDGDDSALPGTVRVAEAPHLLEYTWGGDVLRWDLEATASGTRLTLRHTVQDRDMVLKVAAGWHLCLVVVDQLLADEPIGPIRGDRAMDFGWRELHEAYEAELRRTLGEA